jgi:hypothetical protein
MDTFALRRPDLLADLQVFEVDQPATQAHKRQRLLALGELPPQLHFLQVDFSRENLAAAPRRSAYDPQAPSSCPSGGKLTSPAPTFPLHLSQVDSGFSFEQLTVENLMIMLSCGFSLKVFLLAADGV